MMSHMPKRPFIIFLCLTAVALALIGCQAPESPGQPAVDGDGRVAIQRVQISPLTEFIADPENPDAHQLKVLLEVFDMSGLPVSTAGTVRFELYEFRPLSSDPRGRRLSIWPALDLSNAADAEKYWSQLLRGYEFYLPIDFLPRGGRKYVLEVTCFDGQIRRSDLFKLQFQP